MSIMQLLLHKYTRKRRKDKNVPLAKEVESLGNMMCKCKVGGGVPDPG